MKTINQTNQKSVTILLAEREDAFRHVLTSEDYVFFQALYELEKQEFSHTETRYLRLWKKAFDYAAKGINYDEMVDLLNRYAFKIVSIEENILENVENTYGEDEGFQRFKLTRMNLIHQLMETQKKQCMELYERNAYKELVTN